MTHFALSELIDNRNRQLYEDVSGKLQVELKDSDDDYWGAYSENGVGYVSVAPSNCPISYFTHELLHLWFDSKGMSRPNAFWNPAFPAPKQSTENFVGELIPYAYNQLMHQLMFPHFVRLGFPANEFLNEGKIKETYKQVRSDIAGLKRQQKSKFPHGLPAGLIAFPFLLLKNPHDNSPEVKLLAKQLRSIAGKAYYEEISSIVVDESCCQAATSWDLTPSVN